MDALVEGLMEELNCETVFTIPLFGGIPVYESVVVTWIIMAVVFLLCILLSRNLSVENPSRRQVVVETAIKGLNDFFTETVGEKGKAYIPYLSAIAIYIGIANLIGLLGFKPPTKDMNVTATLALMSIVLIEVAGIRARGTKGWLKSFAEPMPIILPINILEVFIKPLSLCMRLFGNVLGSFVIMELLKMVVPAVSKMADVDVPEVAGLEMLEGQLKLTGLNREIVDAFVEEIVVYAMDRYGERTFGTSRRKRKLGPICRKQQVCYSDWSTTNYHAGASY